MDLIDAARDEAQRSARVMEKLTRTK